MVNFDNDGDMDLIVGAEKADSHTTVMSISPPNFASARITAFEKKVSDGWHLLE